MSTNKPTINGKMVFEFFPEEMLALNREMASGFHPDLERIIAANGGGPDDIDLKIAQTAAYCEVVLDGTYELEERVALCKVLLNRLILKRKQPDDMAPQIIIPPDFSVFQ